MYANFGTPKNDKFSIWKLYLGVPILKHITVFYVTIEMEKIGILIDI